MICRGDLIKLASNWCINRWFKAVLTDRVLFSRSRWTTDSAQQSNQFGMSPYYTHYNCYFIGKHNSLGLGPKPTAWSSPSTWALCLCKALHQTHFGPANLARNSGLLATLLTFFKEWAIPCLFFFIIVFSIHLTVKVQYKFLPMTGFEPQTSGIGSNHSTNWATTTAHCWLLLETK